MQAQNSWKCSRSRGESHVANETAKNLLHAIPAPPPPSAQVDGLPPQSMTFPAITAKKRQKSERGMSIPR